MAAEYSDRPMSNVCLVFEEVRINDRDQLCGMPALSLKF